MASTELDTDRAINLLNQIMEAELAGVVRYTHYSLMVFGHGRIPIVAWLREQASESLLHAQEAGEMITHLGGHPSLGIGHLLETHCHEIEAILRESLDHEKAALALYRDLNVVATAGGSVILEEYARQKLSQEEQHVGDVDKMLRTPGALAPAG